MPPGNSFSPAAAMDDSLEIQTAAQPIRGRLRPPGSKSITNRALVCAALAEGTSQLAGALDSEDTRLMRTALEELGIDVASEDDGRKLAVTGCGGTIPAQSAELSVGNSGTTIRFLTAMLSLGTGVFRLDGVPRMRQRPIADLLNALGQLGVSATSECENGCPPVVVHAHGLPGGRARLRGDVSSQFLSGLLMAAPYAQLPVTLEIVGELVSQPYVWMTIRIMEAFGAMVEVSDDLRQFEIVAGHAYQARDYVVEPDASAASYFWAAAAITGGEVTVEGLTRDSLQGDVAFCECLERMGCQLQQASDSLTIRGGTLRGVDVDMNAISDTVPTLAAVALFADSPTLIRRVGHMRHKETDRIHALAVELRKLGAEVEENEDGLRITPRPLQAASIETYQDHRMAMALSLVGLRQPGVVIQDPGCVAKTYPGYYEDLTALVE